ncbi:MAG TPA: glycosyltransferase family 39 protein [Thermoanaerobaculia bacterium]|jgi:4-amino-4-deoxy-L-arabinose transferase-like glycosyltransferase|nr:glycosyltransferase family 39 protein [Thermoanaerobaculia bacterium]
MPRARLLGAVLLLSVVASPWRRELFVGDETKYGQVVREMRTTGAFFLPTLNGTPFTHKPPVHFWLIDLLTYLFGLYSTWAFVIPSLLGYAFLLWLMWRMDAPHPQPPSPPGGERVAEGRVRGIAAFICGTSLLIWGSAQTARMDVSFTAFITLAAWLLQRFFDRDDFRALLGAALALAVATLIKGPMAPVIALLLFALEWWRRRRVPRGNYLPALAALIVIPLLWLIPALSIGGDAYAHDVLMKQTVGRAVSTWTHNAPPWFYLLRSPAFLFPWFLLAVAAIATRWRERRFELNWILAVLIPYSLLASKLDVYMMALIPPVALLIAHSLEGRFTRMANVAMSIVFIAIGLAGPFLKIKPPEDALMRLVAVKILFAIFIIGGMAAGLLAARRSPIASTLAVGLTPIAALVFAATALINEANAMASTKPLVEAVVRQRVPAEQIWLYTSPYLFTRDMPRELERVQYERKGDPTVIVTARKYAANIDLRGYRKVDEVRMIGKWFDVYRR